MRLCKNAIVAAALVWMTSTSVASLVETFENVNWPGGDQSAGAFVSMDSGEWYVRNRSLNPHQGVFAGDTSVFGAHAGSSYAAMNLNATSGAGPNTIISLWMLSPVVTLNNGDTLSFWTRTIENSQRPDRLEVRMSTNGSSVHLGSGGGMAGAQAVGDFTTLLHTVNPTLAIGGYYEQWTQVSITIDGLNGPTSGRFAFRYFVENGGPTAMNGNYIGIDQFKYPNPTVPGPGAIALLGAIFVFGARRRYD